MSTHWNLIITLISTKEEKNFIAVFTVAGISTFLSCRDIKILLKTYTFCLKVTIKKKLSTGFLQTS